MLKQTEMEVEKSSNWSCVVVQFGTRGLAAAIVYYLFLIFCGQWGLQKFTLVSAT